MTQTPSQKAAEALNDAAKLHRWPESLQKVQEVASLIATHTGCDEAVKLLEAFVEHIESCSEEDLLWCDFDPHPPSVFSHYAEQSRNLLARLNPTKK